MTNWQYSQDILTQRWTCGYCGADVASNKGWNHARGNTMDAYAAICPNCDLPSIISLGGLARPRPVWGSDVPDVPEDVGSLYSEARRAMQAEAYTAAVMAGRKVLMAVAHDNGADEGETFAAYVTWLADSGYITPPMLKWVDEIRKLGNVANHEIEIMSRESAAEVLSFVEMLLRVVYEYPARAEQSSRPRQQDR